MARRVAVSVKLPEVAAPAAIVTVVALKPPLSAVPRSRRELRLTVIAAP